MAYGVLRGWMAGLCASKLIDFQLLRDCKWEGGDEHWQFVINLVKGFLKGRTIVGIFSPPELLELDEQLQA